ncbi:lysylphosphatidylglycerol synthase transmembrane domain-containing protein [Nitrospira sp. Kam-Ns4a]
MHSLRAALLVIGILVLLGLIWHIGLGRLAETVSLLGPGSLFILLLPSLLMYVLEALSWRFTLGRHAEQVSFGRLFAIRTAGEVLNLTTPTAYLGGEPLKAYLLKQQGIAIVDGLASVVTAKTTLTLAQVAFILLGIGLAVGPLGVTGPAAPTAAAVVAVVGLLVFGTAVLLLVQRAGLFVGLLNALRRCRLRIAALERREDKLRALDRTILEFYAGNRRGFLLSTGAAFSGWLAEALEVYVILWILGGVPSPATAIAVAALSVFIKGGTFFIPGSLGMQDGGNLLLVMAFGYSEVTGLTFALLRRLRELVWIAIGLLCLAALGGRPAVALPR